MDRRTRAELFREKYYAHRFLELVVAIVSIVQFVPLLGLRHRTVQVALGCHDGIVELRKPNLLSRI